MNRALRAPLEALDSILDRGLVRLAGCLAVTQVRDVRGIERLLPSRDPFILVANHSSRREIIWLTAILLLVRGGKPVRFLADWNFRLIPGVGYLYDHSGAITVARKPARPAFLTRFRSRYVGQSSVFDQARDALERGESIGLFPEGSINRNAGCLLRPRAGAARLAIATGVPVLPVGIRFLRTRQGGAVIDSTSPMEIRVGQPLLPPPCHDRRPRRAQAGAFATEMMCAVSELCGKAPGTSRSLGRASAATSKNSVETSQEI